MPKNHKMINFMMVNITRTTNKKTSHKFQMWNEL
jgi:hypothetical protein